MSRPFSRSEAVPQPGQLDSELGEFWVTNPWFIQNGHNLSSFERNRLFLNLSEGRFVDISYLSGADSDGDGRGVVAGDFRGTGQLDLVVRQNGGGPLLVFENNLPQQHWLEVSLRGTKSNRLGIGSRVTIEAGGRRQVQELFPINSYRSQMPSRLHFGLGTADRVQRLTIRWPNGDVQSFSDLKADRHLVFEEGQHTVRLVIPGQQMTP